MNPELPDRVPKERYFDADFYRMEVEHFWPRVWQMACRLEEIPAPHDFVEYEILDQSIIVLRTDDVNVRAFQNVCRHRGVQIVEGRGTCEHGFTCPFHGWCYGLDGTNTGIPRRKGFAAHNLQPGDIDLVPVRCEVWGGCAWINFDDAAPPVRECMDPAATILDTWDVESLRTEKWYAARLPVNWKLAIEAFVESYHVVVTHPEMDIPGMRYSLRAGEPFDPRAFIEAEIDYLRVLSDGMDGMVHANDVRVAESLRGVELPADPTLAIPAWNRALNDAVMSWHRARGERRSRPQRSRRARVQRDLLPVLPALLRAAHVQQRLVVPVPSAGTGGDADGDLVARAVPGGRGAGVAHATRAVGGRRSPVATDPRAGLLEPAAAAARPARKGVRVHALVGTGRGSHLELRADPRRLPCRPPVRTAAPGAAVRQRRSLRQADPRHRNLKGHEMSATYADVVEGIRATIAAYTHALDDGRTDDVVATFCTDGVVDIPGMGTHVGHDALRAAYTKWKPRRPQRHLVVNTHVTDWNEHEASAISDVVFLLQGDSGWAIQIVGRYHDTLHHAEGTWRFHRRKAVFVT